MPACKIRKCLPDDVLMFSLGCDVHCPLGAQNSWQWQQQQQQQPQPQHQPPPHPEPHPQPQPPQLNCTNTHKLKSFTNLATAQDHFDRPSCAKYMRRCYYASPLGHVQGLLDRRRSLWVSEVFFFSVSFFLESRNHQIDTYKSIDSIIALQLQLHTGKWCMEAWFRSFSGFQLGDL